MLFRAKNFTLVNGYGNGKTALNAFDNALQNSGVGEYNLIRVSSILPPLCKRTHKIEVPLGSLLPIAYSSICSDVCGEMITAAIGVGIPIDSNSIGVIMEHSIVGNPNEAERIVKQMVENAMANRRIAIKTILVQSCGTTVNIDFSSAFAAVALW